MADEATPETGPIDEPAPAPAPARRPSATRPTVEFLLSLLMGIVLFRSFAAEAYIVPTGSMATTLLGMHRDITCPNCGKRFSIGVDEQGRSGRPVCPNCGQTELAEATITEATGTACSSRNSSSTSARRSGGRSPCSRTRPTRRRRM